MMDNKRFPGEFIRGLCTKECITDEGYVSTCAFQFDKDPRSDRGDSYCELSINWKDDDEAINKILTQKKNGSEVHQFIGYAALDLYTIKLSMKQYIKDKKFSYERKPICEDGNDNPYHGNLLLASGVSNSVRKSVQGALASMAGLAKERET